MLIAPAFEKQYCNLFAEWIKSDAAEHGAKRSTEMKNLPYAPHLHKIPFSNRSEINQSEWDSPRTVEGHKLLEQLRKHDLPSWVHVLPGVLPNPPETLNEYLTHYVKNGLFSANAFLYDDEVIQPPLHIRKFMSGYSDRALRYSDPKVGSFFASLFHLIRQDSVAHVELAGWDLYHGHFFFSGFVDDHDDNSRDDKQSDNNSSSGGVVNCDLGLVFHAKEFPFEYRSSTHGPVYPLGHSNMGGVNDPRIGTKASVDDKDFPTRNYLWLLSTNRVYLLDVNQDSGHPAAMIHSKEFSTVKQSFFSGTQLGDINYFPGLFTKGDDFSIPRQVAIHEKSLLHGEMNGGGANESDYYLEEDELMSPLASAFSSTSRSLSANSAPSVSSPLSSSSSSSQQIVDVGTDGKSDVSSTMFKLDNISVNTNKNNDENSNNTEHKEDSVETVKQQQESSLDAEFEPQAILQKMTRNSWQRWYSEQVAHIVAHSNSCAQDILATPRKAFPVDMVIANSLARIRREIRRLPTRHLELYIKVAQKEIPEPKEYAFRTHRIPDSFIPWFVEACNDQINQKLAGLRQRNDTEENKIKSFIMERADARGFGDDVDMNQRDLKMALENTANHSGPLPSYSAWRASSMLEIMFGRYRSDERIALYGKEDYKLDLVEQVFQLTVFDVDSSLEAIVRWINRKVGKDAQNGQERTLAEIAQKICRRKNEEADRRWREKQETKARLVAEQFHQKAASSSSSSSSSR